MEPVIDPINKNVIESELTSELFLRKTNKANNEIYIITSDTAPNTLQEIGRLREITYRAAGGSSGLSCDLDQYDTMDNPYKQLIVWNPEAKEIIGGYRYILGKDVTLDQNGQPNITSSHLFKYSDEFIRDYLPSTVELGRAFVTLEYQSSKAGAKGLFALDNLWDGLGALVIKEPSIKHFMGKVTMYQNYNKECRDLILAFLDKYFKDKDHLAEPYYLLRETNSFHRLQKLFSGVDFKEDYKILNKAIRETGYNIPPMINAYISLSPSMRVFGSCTNDELSDAIETGIMISFSEMFQEKYNRHIESYLKDIISQQEEQEM